MQIYAEVPLLQDVREIEITLLVSSTQSLPILNSV